MEKRQTAKRVWLTRSFFLFWLATVFSALGDSANFILASWYVVDVTGSEGTLGTVLLCMSLPRLFFMLAGGVVADRLNRKYIMAFSGLARAVVLSVFALAFLSGNTFQMQVGLYLMAVLFGIVDAFFWPARDSMIPQIVQKEHLAPANSLLQTSQQLSMVVGPLLAALLFRLSNYSLRFMTVAALFLAAALLLSGIRISQSIEVQPVKDSAISELAAGIRYVLKIRPITLIMIAAMLINLLIMGPLNIALPVLVKKLGWGGSAFSYLEGFLGVGAIVGGLVTGLAKGFRGHLRIVAMFIAIMGSCFATVGLMTSVGFGLAAMMLTGIMMSMVNIPVVTYVQTITDSSMLGRVMSLLSLMSMGLGPVSYALTSFILQQKVASSQMVILVGGFAMAVAGLSLLLIKGFRTIEEHPAWKNVDSSIV